MYIILIFFMTIEKLTHTWYQFPDLNYTDIEDGWFIDTWSLGYWDAHDEVSSILLSMHQRYGDRYRSFTEKDVATVSSDLKNYKSYEISDAIWAMETINNELRKALQYIRTLLSGVELDTNSSKDQIYIRRITLLLHSVYLHWFGNTEAEIIDTLMQIQLIKASEDKNKWPVANTLASSNNWVRNAMD